MTREQSIQAAKKLTFTQRASAVDAIHGGSLEEHICCPQCSHHMTHYVSAKPDDSACCNRCGWTGKVLDLLDTVQTGDTLLG